VQAWRRWLWAPPTKPRALAWASASRETPRAVDLARAAAHRRGGEVHTVIRVSTIVDQNSP
jgi:hypothetical protein